MSSNNSNPSKSLWSKKSRFIHIFTRKSKKSCHQSTTEDAWVPATSPSQIAPSPTTHNAPWTTVPYTQEPGPIQTMSLASPTFGNSFFPFPNPSQTSYTPTDSDIESSVDSEFSEEYTSPSSHDSQIQTQQGYAHHLYTSQSGHGIVATSAYQASTHQSYSSDAVVATSAYQASMHQSYSFNAVVGQTAHHSRSGGERNQTVTYTSVATGGHHIHSYTNNSVSITGTNNSINIF